MDDISKPISLNETVWMSIKIWLTFVANVPVNNIPALDQMMALCWKGDKPLSEPMIVRSPTHICITRPQWVDADDYLMSDAHAMTYLIHLSCYHAHRKYERVNWTTALPFSVCPSGLDFLWCLNDNWHYFHRILAKSFLCIIWVNVLGVMWLNISIAFNKIWA